jgi:hypothetical protein
LPAIAAGSTTQMAPIDHTELETALAKDREEA